jgi:hypothetical protein
MADRNSIRTRQIKKRPDLPYVNRVAFFLTWLPDDIAVPTIRDSVDLSSRATSFT